MAYVLYGAGGMLLALAVLLTGAVAGWKARGLWQEHARREVAKEATEEEKRQLEAEQEAFRSLLNYNAGQAYGEKGEET